VVAAPSDAGRLPVNVMGFVRMLRRAGLPVGPAHTVRAVQALDRIDLTNKREFYWALHSTLVSKPEHRAIFGSAFRLFWRDPFGADAALQALLSKSRASGTQAERKPPARLEPQARDDGAARGSEHQGADHDEPPEMTVFRLASSPVEALRTKDFEDMTTDEVAAAKEAMRRLRMELPTLRTRRFRPEPRGGAIDMRRTLRSAFRTGAEPIQLERRSPSERRPALVVLADVSGSMEPYSRILLHFLHALTNTGDRVHTFLFGTRLTNVTRMLRDQDVDRALDRVGSAVTDWHGGTRIGGALRQFNLRWSRRLLSQGAVVLLVSDGLDREGGSGIAREAERLRRSCRRLVWLNPLLRFEGFEPRAAGVRALLPHVDEHRTVHNLVSLEQLAESLSGPGGSGYGAAASRAGTRP
jgi:uncharacterized protein with von Willebrand factor type A (vWA) domain